LKSVENTMGNRYDAWKLIWKRQETNQKQSKSEQLWIKLKGCF